MSINAMKYTEIAKTPQEFMQMLNEAEVIPRTPDDPPEVVAHVKFKERKETA